MSFNFRSYIENAAVHSAVDLIMEGQINHVNIEGREWTVLDNKFVIDNAMASLLQKIAAAVKLFFIYVFSNPIFRPTFRKDFNAALLKLNELDKLTKQNDELKSQRDKALVEVEWVQNELDLFDKHNEGKNNIKKLKQVSEAGLLQKLNDLIDQIRELDQVSEVLQSIIDSKDDYILIIFVKKMIRGELLEEKQIKAKEEKVNVDKNRIALDVEIKKVEREINKIIAPLKFRADYINYFNDDIDKLIEVEEKRKSEYEIKTKSQYDELNSKLEVNKSSFDSSNLEYEAKRKQIENLKISKIIVNESVVIALKNPEKVENKTEEQKVAKKIVKDDSVIKLIVTPYTKVNEVVKLINKKTECIHLANLWATLLEKFSQAYGDVVESVSYQKGKITINLKKINDNKHPYRMWIKSFAGEPVGGVIITLDNTVVIIPNRNELVIESGYVNYVKIPPKYTRFLGYFWEYIEASTQLMVVKNQDDIGITAGAMGNSDEKITNAALLKKNWQNGIVITDPHIASKVVLKEHEEAQDYTAESHC